METAKLKRFASYARRTLLAQVGTKLDSVLAEGSPARRENDKAVRELEQELQALGREQLVERVAYIWFNRFCALRYMDINRYTRIGIVSPELGRFQPEILAEAKAGHLDAELVPEATGRHVSDLLDGSRPSPDPQGEAYRLLLVAACNHYHRLMPFLFEKISDYTELLLPDDLLSGDSILAYTREALLPINCSPEHTEESVEVIGWLYQFYIAEKKDQVFEGLKKGTKITPENIPAATQLFTPHWIVRYLVENSLGRLWMLNHPDSKLVERMEYYIQPEEPETDFLRITSPEEIKVCDPACGSGHMLTYAFDLLYAIYEEQGYQASDIPALILQKNLYGIEIDPRAGALAAFALTMKARERHRRFLTGGTIVQPNICVLQNIRIEPDDLSAYMDKVGRDLFTGGLQGVVNQFEEANNFGSLIRPLVTDVREVLELLRERQMGQELFLADVHQKVLKALKQAEYLRPMYHVVVANPPYMAAKGMNGYLKQFAAKAFPGSSADLYAMFIERALQLAIHSGRVGLMTPFTWMFLAAFERLRGLLLDEFRIESLVRPEYHAFFESAYVPICAFGITKAHSTADSYIVAIDLSQFYGAEEQPFRARTAIAETDCPWRFTRRLAAFREVPGMPLSFSLDESLIESFQTPEKLGDVVDVRGGMTTGSNETFVRYWFEPSFAKSSLRQGFDRQAKWFPYNKGGPYRKWYGNRLWVVNWANDGEEIKATGRASVRSEDKYGLAMIGWTDVTSLAQLGVRLYETGFLFDASGPAVFPNASVCVERILGYLGSRVVSRILNALNPTLHVQAGNIASLPWFQLDESGESGVVSTVRDLIEISREDWNSQELSWDFSQCPLIKLHASKHGKLARTLRDLRASGDAAVKAMLTLEHLNDETFYKAFKVSPSIAGHASSRDITLICNPLYRYDSEDSESELEAFFVADTMREFISYAVGCMFGRYSLDEPGLILANQGETAEDYRRRVPEPSFPPDEDNVIPVLDGDWFSDDISERFKKFLKVTFGTEHYEENLTFLENGLYPENLHGKRRKTVRDYFLKEFYDHHLKMYKKRPIYWMFSSPKGTFNALIYMHRYRPDTVSLVLNEYLREFQAKIAAKIEHLQTVATSASASAAAKGKALKEITTLKKYLKELGDYERDVLYPLAARQVEIDLDDGVRVNYNKFGKALKKVVGLSE